MDKNPLVSIIIPVYNAAQHLDRCLTAIMASSYDTFEVIVVDDGSTDDSVEIAEKRGATVLRHARRSGPAAARNYGAQHAKGEILFFVDADVAIQPDSVARVAADFQEHPDVSALFGSYDESPAETNFLSQYKNLHHHFVHQESSEEAVTFWSGCGAIRREIFLQFNGFDEKRYPKPAIEDIELGCRLNMEGHRILLDKQLQVKHLKQWRLKSLLRADIFYRAIPWTKLMLESQGLVNDLNLQTSHRLSAGLVGLSLVLLPFSLFEPRLLYGVLACLGLIFILNFKLYRFFIQHKGLPFLILAFPFHLFYYFYSSVTFVLCWFMHKVKPT